MTATMEIPTLTRITMMPKAISPSQGLPSLLNGRTKTRRDLTRRLLNYGLRVPRFGRDREIPRDHHRLEYHHSLKYHHCLKYQHLVKYHRHLFHQAGQLNQAHPSHQ